jgi:L-lysine exporter family protein LysE/ArgO
MMLSLIVAIGAQNTFLLRQGLLRRHVTPLVLICWISDVALVLVGVSGIGAIVGTVPMAMTVLKVCGALVLFGYAAFALRRAARGESLELDGNGVRQSLGSAIATCLAITWLNPHVYLDTVVMIGAVANTHGEPGRWWFALGTVVGSVAWFAALGYGARLLRPLFRKPRAWRILDTMIAMIMVAVGVRLLVS